MGTDPTPETDANDPFEEYGHDDGSDVTPTNETPDNQTTDTKNTREKTGDDIYDWNNNIDASPENPVGATVEEVFSNEYQRMLSDIAYERGYNGLDPVRNALSDVSMTNANEFFQAFETPDTGVSNLTSMSGSQIPLNETHGLIAEKLSGIQQSLGTPLAPNADETVGGFLNRVLEADAQNIINNTTA